MNSTVDPPRKEECGDFKSLLDLATPELYERNAFRLLGVHVEASERDLAKRKQVMEMASRNRLPVPAGPCAILPRTVTPDDHEIRECCHAIGDAERRLAQEFFWFWPLSLGQAGNDPALRQLHQGDSDGAASIWCCHEGSLEEGPASKHNLAVLYHFAALEIENGLLNDKAPPPLPGTKDQGETQVAEAERFWMEADKYWTMVAVEQSCWSRVASRIRAIDDHSLTTGAARRMERRLPVALTLINARLAARAHQNGKSQHARRHAERIRKSGFDSDAVNEALRIAVEPTRSGIKTLCDLAKKDAAADPAKADAVAERLLDQTAGLLALLDLLLPEDHPSRIAEHDQVAISGLVCAVEFVNKTDQWKRALELLDRVAPLAVSSAAKGRISHNQTVVQGNLESSLCWFCRQEQKDEKCVHEVAMYGDVLNLGYKVTWRHLKVEVPRCKACKDEASKWDAFGGFVGIVGIIGIFASIGLCGAMDSGVGLLIGIIIALALIGVGYCIVNSMMRPGIKKRAANDYPRIKELQSRGWTFGSGPSQ